MAVEHNMAESNTTWWDLLRTIVSNLEWSYAALWTLTADSRNLIWKQGFFHTRSNDDAHAELFHSLYSTCTFSPGVGFAGHALAHMTNTILWQSGDELDRLECPVPNQTAFLRAVDIQTVVCLPLGHASNSYVLELGTVDRVRGNEARAHQIRTILLSLLADGLPHLINENPLAGIAQPGAHQPAPELFREQMRASPDSNPHPQSFAAMADEIPIPLVSARNATNFAPSNFEGGAHPRAQQRHPGSNIFSESLQSLEHGEIFARQVAQGLLNAVPPQLSVEVPELAGSVEPSLGERLTSPCWATETSMSQMEMNAFQSWTSMAEATSTVEVALRGLPGSSSAASLRLARIDPNDEIGQILPFPFEQLMAGDQQPQPDLLLGALTGPASLRGSSSRSSMSFRSQNVEDNEISSAMLEGHADFHISEMDGSRGGGGGTGGSSSTTIAGESESTWGGGAQLGSGPSSKETSPDSNVPYIPSGIHPRISLTSSLSSSRKQQQQPVVDIQQHGSTPTGPGPSQPQRTASRPFERQHSNVLEPIPQEDLKPGPGKVGDSTPRLVQFGNVLQLGNAAGQVTEPLPQEHDDVAVSHMLAERRRRTKQNENFNQLKFLIPSTGKMDKASLLAATITYINDLTKRVKDLEESNQKLKTQLLGEDESSTVDPLRRTKSRGSPSGVRVRTPNSRTPNSLSPTDEDKIQVSSNGDGNLTIEIRSSCTQPDITMHIFECLKEMQLRVVNFNVAVNDNRIHGNIIVKMKRKNSAGQSAVCAEVERALTACLFTSG